VEPKVVKFLEEFLLKCQFDLLASPNPPPKPKFRKHQLIKKTSYGG
jgi:hypothetical protein